MNEKNFKDSKSYKETQNSSRGNRATNNNSRTKRKGRSNRSKRMEINFNDSDVNKADLPHILFDGSKHNDPEWYSHIYAVFADVANKPFNIPTGISMDLLTGQAWNATQAKPTIAPQSMKVPGVFALEVGPTIGISQGQNSAVNIAAQQLYSVVRQANSGATNYDKTDLMMMILAMDSAYMLYEWLVRAYKTISSYDYLNRYTPTVLLQAMHFGSAITEQMADFKAAIDLFAYQLSSINVPDQLDYIKRHSWMFSNIYTDSKDARAQYYLYVPYSFYKWTEGEGSSPTYLSTVFWDGMAGDGITGDSQYITKVSQIRNMINTLMQPLLGSEDVGTMSGDLAKAFGDNMFKISPMGEGFQTITPVYSMEVVNQMMNSTSFQNISGLDVTQNLNNTAFGPYLSCTPSVLVQQGHNGFNASAISCRKNLLNLHEVEPTPDNVMTSTRNLIGIKDATTSTSLIPIYTMGSEIIWHMYVWTMLDDTSGASGPASRLEVYSDIETGRFSTPDVLETSIVQMLRMSTFDNHPTVYCWREGGSPTSPHSFDGIFQDIDCYTTLTHEELKQLHDTALMSLFAVKEFGKGIESYR